MKLFDTHCDTVMKVKDGSLDFAAGEGTGHVDMYVTITGAKKAIVGEYALSDDPVNAAIVSSIQSYIATGITPPTSPPARGR